MARAVMAFRDELEAASMRSLLEKCVAPAAVTETAGATTGDAPARGNGSNPVSYGWSGQYPPGAWRVSVVRKMQFLYISYVQLLSAS